MGRALGCGFFMTDSILLTRRPTGPTLLSNLAIFAVTPAEAWRSIARVWDGFEV
jgi:hypothetical protein